MSFFKKLCYNQISNSGRNSLGRITALHRGGRHKRKIRRIYFQTLNIPKAYSEEGFIEKIEYDPFRSSPIALVRWLPSSNNSAYQNKAVKKETLELSHKQSNKDRNNKVLLNNSLFNETKDNTYSFQSKQEKEYQFDQKVTPSPVARSDDSQNLSPFSYILVSENVMNSFTNFAKKRLNKDKISNELTKNNPPFTDFNPIVRIPSKKLCDIPIGSYIYNIQIRKGEQAKYVRAAGTFAVLLQKMNNQCLIRLPSGQRLILREDCTAQQGRVAVSYSTFLSEKQSKNKYKKAGQARWRGIRPSVRQVAMNAVDKKHGGGRPSTLPTKRKSFNKRT